MSDHPTGKQSIFQTLQSVLPVYNPLHKHRDEENTIGAEPASTLPANLTDPPQDEKTRKTDGFDIASSQLTLFRSLVGIENPPGLHTSSFFRSGRPAPNVGIYARVISAESKAAHSYKLFSAFISFCIGAQVLVAACLTALGAGNASHKAVTAFGALNTVLAGFMAYFKGSGLPNRLKYYQNEWTKLREYIEQRERDFCRKECQLDLESEILVIERMYEDIKSDIEANTPDSFVSVRDISKRGGGVNPGPSLARGTSMVIDTAADRIHDRVVVPTERSVAGLKRNLSYQSSHLGDKVSEKVACYGDRYNEKITSYFVPYQEKAAAYNDKITGLAEKAASYNDKIAHLDERVHGYASRVSNFVEKPHSVGVTIDSTRIESPQSREVAEKGNGHESVSGP
ncbi:uncharacterized protein PV09_06836 [Verruconis gallopava]|uniref:SMODS and SLOG-associating 2TM effector domain-containing protein n=1 Tax=Verruconis gallopava TaxID=253628 RepID=A0A0D1XHE9_9PEZI|nr:uncharacterized protein PV09_06836 [Verruconis gallopava]KIW01651.1 hypothetical protein PV09_06836 [Verruconis gallopava]